MEDSSKSYGQNRASCGVRVSLLPGFPYHVTHRGNRRAPVFFCDDDRQTYLARLAEQSARHGRQVWAWCLMTNHIHLIVMPQKEDAMATALGRPHMQYARKVNRDHGSSGHLWANRYHSSPLDWDHLWQGVRYVELNPVRAGMVAHAQDYAWSSCRKHAAPCEPTNFMVTGSPFPGHVGSPQWCD